MNNERTTKGNILIIDDDPLNLKILHEHLTQAEYKVYVFQSAIRALPRIPNLAPDMILMDVYMEGMDGFEACRLIKENPETKDIPLIFITGGRDPTEVVRGFESGAVDYIIKPFQLQELLARISTHLSIQRLKRQLLSQNEQLQQEILDRIQAERLLIEKSNQLSLVNSELSRAMRIKDEFLANMSHELRTPLNAVLGMTEALEEGVYGELQEEQTKPIHTIGESGGHLLSLINDILDLSKIEAGKMELNPEWVILDHVIQASLKFVKQQAFKKKLALSYTLDPLISQIYTDERRLKQILVNLLSNAVKFTPDGGKVLLNVTGDLNAECIRFDVIDTGIGIAAADQPLIFKPFAQIDSSLSRQYEGTGLGLNLVARLVDLMGGGIEMESHLGTGSRFSIILPCLPGCMSEQTSFASQEVALSVLKEEIHLPENPSAPLILIADDNDNFLNFLFNTIKGFGYRVITARNNDEVIQHFRELKPALILMDIQMPNRNGAEVIQEIRATHSAAEIPIVALTSIIIEGQHQDCLSAGANICLNKPINSKRLQSILLSYL